MAPTGEVCFQSLMSPASGRSARHSRGRAWFLALAGVGAIASMTQAAPPELVGESWVQEVDGTALHGLDVFISFASPLNRALLVYNTSLSVQNAQPGAKFYHAESGSSASGGTALPLYFAGGDVVLGEIDTFVTIGGSQASSGGMVMFMCGTPYDMFVSSTSIDSEAGWFKTPPCGEDNTAGPDQRVRIARFVLADDDWTPNAYLSASWTLVWENTFPEGALFKTVSGTFAFDDESAEIPYDEPGYSYESPAGGGGGPIAVPPPPIGDLADKEVFWVAGNSIVGWAVDGFEVSSAASLSTNKPSDLLPAGAADLDGDGDRDLLWRHPVTGAVTGWLMESGDIEDVGVIGSPPIPGNDWALLATDDMTGDGREDLVWRRIDGGMEAVRVWKMNGLVRLNDVQIGVSPGFEFVATSDMDGDGRTDILWRLANGSLMSWLSNGMSSPTAKMITGCGAVPSTWSAVASPDLDGDGDRDLLWRNSNNGNVNGWLLQGTAKVAGGLVAPALGPIWEVADACDLDGDGDDDVLFRNLVTHGVNVWTMQGLTKAAGGTVTTVSDGWVTIR